ncbi:agmatine deiminase family protein [Endozoicomonas acroporae]|uniref:agmatine deiminase family protein n=1 Tax=Endozoicomonas acroporae TaxID=1701104 RepID=UPI003D7AC334
MQETHVSFIPTTNQVVIRQGSTNADARRNNDHQSSWSRFSNWVVSNPKKALASTLGLAGAGVGAYFLARELTISGNVGSSAIANSNISPTNPTFSLLPNQDLSPTDIEFMTKSVSELPTSVLAPPLTTPDWYKASTSTAQPSSESQQSSTWDSAISLPDPPSQTTTMAPDSQLPTELPTLSTITPSSVSNSHPKTTVAAPEKKKSLSPTAIEFMTKSVSELPTSVIAPPLTTPDWYKASTSTAQPSSESQQSSTRDSAISLPDPSSQTATMASDSQLPTELPTLSTITPSSVSNSHPKTTVAAPEKKKSLSPTAIEFMTESVSELPTSVLAPPLTTPDWYEALTSSAQPSSESRQSSTRDSAISLPDPPSKTTTMAPDSQLPTELPTLSTITPSSVSNSHPKTTVAAPEKKKSLSPTTIKFMTKSVSELPTSVIAPPLTTPDWYKASTSTAQPSSESLQSSTRDSAISLPAPSSQTTTMAPDSQLPTELPTLSTITPSTVSNSPQNTTVATAEGKTTELIIERPYAEFEPAGYLAFSDTDFRDKAYGESRAIKRKIVRNLPRDVHLIVYTSGDPERTRQTFQPYFGDMKRFHVLKVKPAWHTRYWARDGLPVPVYSKNGSLVLVDSKYRKGFEPDQAVANFFNVTLLSHPFKFEGGNLLADSKGNCFTVNNWDMRRQLRLGFTDEIFKKCYGCKRLTRLKNKTKVGHVDEVIKIIDDKNIITDRRAYRPILQELGYNVTMMPRAKGNHTSYLNSVIINGNVFVPVYGHKKTDKMAMAIYRSFGLKAYKFRSNKISEKWEGSIHCSMVTYPKIGNNKPATSGIT